MVESFKDKVAIFRRGQQRAFIETVEKKYHIDTIAEMCSCSTRTIRDWRREKFNMRLSCVRSLAKQARIPMPRDMKIRDAYSHTSAAGRKGAHIVIQKYGRVPVDESRRRDQWRKWWDTTGKFKPVHRNFFPKPTHRPPRTLELAEFIGTMMGDGGLSKYQACITLHHIDDRKYIDFVVERIQKLFHVTPALYHVPKDSIFNIVISRVEVVKYLHTLGLPIGNKIKQKFDIPEWIQLNRKFSIACVRGLVDTDGSIFTHSYKVKGKWYRYKKLTFCTHSQPLQYSVAKILTDLGMRARISGYDVRLDSIADMEKYFALVGSSNPKHLERYAK